MINKKTQAIDFNTPISEIIKLFNEARDNSNKEISLKISDGFIYITGGILGMLKGTNVYMAVGKKNEMRWELVWDN